MIVFDTSVLVYAVGQDHRLRPPARQLLDLLDRGAIGATTTVEVIQEFTHVRGRRGDRADAARRARQYVAALSPLIRPDAEDLVTGIDLFTQSADLDSFDAVLAAAARRRGLALISGDRAFSQVAGLRFLDLSSPTLVEDAVAAG